MPELTELRNEALKVMDLHTHLLRKLEEIDPDHAEAGVFTLRSFGYILQNLPEVLVRDTVEDAMSALFEYYGLLTELKYNLKLNYPYAILFGKPILEIIERYPTTYHQELNEWFEAQNGVDVVETKQTMDDKALD
ncbi:MAG: hypothetical protein LBM95_06935 [Lactobacillales bacterium]|jgi:hypothetical protein|nr:hypothetical protein [Lactobacillales bacterium]